MLKQTSKQTNTTPAHSLRPADQFDVWRREPVTSVLRKHSKEVKSTARAINHQLRLSKVQPLWPKPPTPLTAQKWVNEIGGLMEKRKQRFTVVSRPGSVLTPRVLTPSSSRSTEATHQQYQILPMEGTLLLACRSLAAFL